MIKYVKTFEEAHPEILLEREISDRSRKIALKRGKALPGPDKESKSVGSFPIFNVGDLKAAIKAHGRAKDIEKAKAHIKRQASKLGRPDLLPESW